jgi:hypothetical protein
MLAALTTEVSGPTQMTLWVMIWRARIDLLQLPGHREYDRKVRRGNFLPLMHINSPIAKKSRGA